VVEPGVCEVWWAHTSSADECLLALLDDAEQARFERFRLAADKSRYLAAHALARLVLAGRIGTDPAALELRPDVCRCGQLHGKPRLLGEHRDLEFSLSHSGGRVVVAITTMAPVGVDVEEIRMLSDIEGVAAVVLAEPERRELHRLPASDRSAALLTYWTRKEALLKATGDGLSRPMIDIVMSAPDKPAAVLAWTGAQTRRVQVFSLAPGPEYLASLALLTGDRVRVRQLDGDPVLWSRRVPSH
jgi:4'-phosphopantetheinyl transferase